MTRHFLSSEIENGSFSESLFHVIPAPLEQTVSYGTGTSRGPDALLEASDQLETWDGESIPCSEGIHTVPALDNRPGEEFLAELEAKVAASAGNNSIPAVIGGEHTVTLAAVRAFYKRCGSSLGVVQFDAHADLRYLYEGDPLSHACVMRRIHEETGCGMYQAGIRSESKEEFLYRKQHNIACLPAREACRKDLRNLELPDTFPPEVYLTFDIDCLDGALFPATGTPVPGGLSWYQALDMIASIARQRRIVGFDVVEFSPIEGLHFCDAAAAQLVYNIMGIIQRSPKRRVIPFPEY